MVDEEGDLEVEGDAVVRKNTSSQMKASNEDGDDEEGVQIQVKNEGEESINGDAREVVNESDVFGDEVQPPQIFSAVVDEFIAEDNRRIKFRVSAAVCAVQSSRVVKLTAV